MKMLVSMMFLASGAMAQTVEVPLAGKLDLGKVVGSMRADYVYTIDAQKLAGAHLPVATVHTSSGMEIVNFDAGMVWDTADGVGGPFVAVGGRVDNIAVWLKGKDWFTRHFSTMAFPTLEAGPFVGYVSRQGFLYGGFISVGFGGG